MIIRPMLRFFRSGRTDFRSKATLMMGALTHPRQLSRWLHYLSGDPALWDLALRHPRFIVKVFRPYLSRRLTCAERVNVLMHHYALIERENFIDFVRRVSSKPKTLCEFAGKSGKLFQIEISASELHIREGEFFLHLICDKTSLYRAAFSFVAENGQHFVKIGCVQGLRSDNGAESIREATREFHSTRPRNLLVSVVRDIGAYFGCHGAIGVSSANRLLAYGGRNEKTPPDYDGSWEDMGGVQRADGDFEFPCTGMLKTSFDAIPSKKRAEAKRKTALLESIFHAVRSSLDEERSLLPAKDTTKAPASSGHTTCQSVA